MLLNRLCLLYPRLKKALNYRYLTSQNLNSKYLLGFPIHKFHITRLFEWEKSSVRIFRAFRLFGVSLGSGLCFLRKAHCKNITRRTSVEQTIRLQTSPLTWADLWRLIKPYFHWLVVAALGAIVAAILNIQIPIMLGDLINVIAGFLITKTAVDLSKINPIAVDLLVLYAGQAVFTFLYITCLSIMGERIAADLRVRLFEHLLHFDMTFYDRQRTSELNDRLNFDVQEFKSCFKACVAQGLRTSAQNFHLKHSTTPSWNIKN